MDKKKAISASPSQSPSSGVGQKKVCLAAEPTDAMIEAGVAVLWESGVVEGQLDSDELLVADIFRAMIAQV